MKAGAACRQASQLPSSSPPRHRRWRRPGRPAAPPVPAGARSGPRPRSRRAPGPGTRPRPRWVRRSRASRRPPSATSRRRRPPRRPGRCRRAPYGSGRRAGPGATPSPARPRRTPAWPPGRGWSGSPSRVRRTRSAWRRIRGHRGRTSGDGSWHSRSWSLGLGLPPVSGRNRPGRLPSGPVARWRDGTSTARTPGRNGPDLRASGGDRPAEGGDRLPRRGRPGDRSDGRPGADDAGSGLARTEGALPAHQHQAAQRRRPDPHLGTHGAHARGHPRGAGGSAGPARPHPGSGRAPWRERRARGSFRLGGDLLAQPLEAVAEQA